MHLGSVEHSQSSLRYLLPFRNNAPALFSGSEEAVGCFGMELNISFPAPGCQELTEVAMNANIVLFVRSLWPQKLLLPLWVKNRRVTWSESVVATPDKASP